MIQPKEVNLVSTLVAPSRIPSLERYLAITQVQPLTALMEEIIAFQLEEQALFTNFESSTNCLN
ncbi:hypothetical protein GXP67_36480 [Rhodocytophaga rosea]|uniref:Uncharacterized protein n=1 Tax=Rhodocytophaga rosea TaxID=2704465 RepID=A0A6C0GW31_9BACT|nr:hypothetical protein [Rhodocytophaga rosea]QHT71773.1 hypothetical protein GXP67_36480 [Rhodocytophaga rosea]